MSDDVFPSIIPWAVPTAIVVVLGAMLLLERRNSKRAIHDWARQHQLVELELVTGSLRLCPSFGTRVKGDGGGTIYRFSASGPDGSPVKGWVQCTFRHKSTVVIRVEALFDGQPRRPGPAGFPIVPPQ